MTLRNVMPQDKVYRFSHCVHFLFLRGRSLFSLLCRANYRDFLHLITYLLSCHTFTPIEKRAIFSKLHSFCSLRDVRNCTLSKRPRVALPNQVRLHPSNERPRLVLHWQQLKMAAVRALALFTTRTVSLFLSRRNAMRTE